MAEAIAVARIQAFGDTFIFLLDLARHLTSNSLEPLFAEADPSLGKALSMLGASSRAPRPVLTAFTSFRSWAVADSILANPGIDLAKCGTRHFILAARALKAEGARTDIVNALGVIVAIRTSLAP